METRSAAWRGEPAWFLSGGGYEAVVLPRYGANCVSLRHALSGADLLRTPRELCALRDQPNVYGLPILFPPNRIADGRFAFQGRTYSLPVNEPGANNHIHGRLSGTPFEPIGGGAFAHHAPPCPGFPHAFTVIRRYALDERGLEHTITVTNDGDADMPLGVGVHAAWRVPFFDGDDARGYALRVPVRRQWLVSDDRHLPTGRFIEDSPLLDALRRGALSPDEQPLSCLLERGEGEITLACARGAFAFEPGDSLPFIMLWNGGGGQGFICPEPQSMLTNAPNLTLPPDVTGLRELRPGETARDTMRFSFRASR